MKEQLAKLLEELSLLDGLPGHEQAVFLADRVIVLSARPARMVAAIQVNLPRPRTMELKAEKEFGRLCLEIYRLLEEK